MPGEIDDLSARIAAAKGRHEAQPLRKWRTDEPDPVGMVALGGTFAAMAFLVAAVAAIWGEADPGVMAFIVLPILLLFIGAGLALVQMGRDISKDEARHAR